MRRDTFRIALLVCAATVSLTGAGVARAEAPKERADTGGGGSGGGGASAGGSGAGGDTSGRNSLDTDGGTIAAKAVRAKPWEVYGSWETHGLLWQDNTGNARYRVANFAYGYAQWNISKNDRLRLGAGFYEYFLADQTETGIRSTDLRLSYSHLFNLPKAIDLRVTASATAPISYDSQHASLITEPQLSFNLTRSFGGFSVDLYGFGRGYIVKCSSYGSLTSNSTGDYSCNGAGGLPNAKAEAGGQLEAEYAFWFHKPLVLGADVYTAYIWYYDANGSLPPGAPQNTAPQIDGTFAHQPVQQVYGGEVFVRYTPPTFYGIHPELLVALADGDPTLGYASVNLDGVQHIYFNLYQNFEAYGSVSFRY